LPAHTGDGYDSTDAIKDEASLLISEEVERKLISVIEDSFSAASSVRAVWYIYLYCLFNGVRILF
jgi:hypothetical protein